MNPRITACIHNSKRKYHSWYDPFRSLIFLFLLQSPGQFLSDYKRKIAGHNYTSQNFAPYGYDSVWVIAHALRTADNILRNQGLTLLNFSYENPLVGDVILEAVNHSMFTGITVNKSILLQFHA